MVRESPPPLELVKEYLRLPASTVCGLELPPGLAVELGGALAHGSHGFRFIEPFQQLLPPLIVVELPRHRLLELNSGKGLQENWNPTSQAFGGLAMGVRNLGGHCWPHHGPPFLHFHLLDFISVCNTGFKK